MKGVPEQYLADSTLPAGKPRWKTAHSVVGSSAGHHRPGPTLLLSKQRILLRKDARFIIIKGPIQQQGITIHTGYVPLESQFLDTQLQNIQRKTEEKVK